MSRTSTTLLTLTAIILGVVNAFPVFDQPIFEAPGLPKPDVYFQGGVTSQFTKQLTSLPLTNGDQVTSVNSNEYQINEIENRVVTLPPPDSGLRFTCFSSTKKRRH